MNIEVNRSAKAYAKATTTIRASVEDVFATLTNINSWPEWQSNVDKAVIDGEVAVGKTFNWKAGGLPIRSKLHTVNPPSELGWTGRIWWITAIHNWTLQEQDGLTVVTVEESLGGFLSSLMKKTLEQGMIENLKELKAAVEND